MPEKNNRPRAHSAANRLHLTLAGIGGTGLPRAAGSVIESPKRARQSQDPHPPRLVPQALSQSLLLFAPKPLAKPLEGSCGFRSVGAVPALFPVTTRYPRKCATPKQIGPLARSAS